MRAENLRFGAEYVRKRAGESHRPECSLAGQRCNHAAIGQWFCRRVAGDAANAVAPKVVWIYMAGGPVVAASHGEMHVGCVSDAGAIGVLYVTDNLARRHFLPCTEALNGHDVYHFHKDALFAFTGGRAHGKVGRYADNAAP